MSPRRGLPGSSVECKTGTRNALDHLAQSGQAQATGRGESQHPPSTASKDAAGGLTWEFICECGEEGCAEHVGPSLARYDELRKADLALLARGHPRRRARGAQRREQELRADATALKNQAHHQHTRSRRIADDFRGLLSEFRCAECGYGACGRTPPPSCPMCRSASGRRLRPGLDSASARRRRQPSTPRSAPSGSSRTRK